MLTSCDTNIFLYYLNEQCVEHSKAKAFLSSQFINEKFAVCELVLIELYILIRNPSVVKNPLSNQEAVQVVESFRSNPRWRVIDYPGGLMNEIWQTTNKRKESRQNIFDTRLAFTLRYHGVSTFATHNVKDFSHFDFLKVINPIGNN